MKKQLLLLVTLLLSIGSFSQCNYTFVMKDAFGDGWNGNTMTVRQNGVDVATFGADFYTGSQVPVQVTLQDNVPFELFWNAGGGFANEVGVSIINPFNQTIYSMPFFGVGLQNTLLYYGAANCQPSTCIAPYSLLSNNIGPTFAEISWTSPNPNPSQWEVLVLPATSPAPDATQSGIVSSINSFMVTGLICSTNYKAYVRQVCGPSDNSPWSGAFSFQTANCIPATTSVCTGAIPLCDALGNIFPNTVNNASQGTMGCLTLSSNPTWFSFSIGAPGDVRWNLTHNTSFNSNFGGNGSDLDVKYIVYGPYASPITTCSSQLTADKIVACDYSVGSSKNISFTATNVGDYYYLMVSSAYNNTGFFVIRPTLGDTGAIDCNGFRLDAFVDSNTNGIKDSGERSIAGGNFVYEKNNDSNVHTVYSSAGGLDVFEQNPSNSYNFSYQLNPSYTSHYNSPTSFNGVSAIANGMTNINFPILSSDIYSNASVSVLIWDLIRPNRQHALTICYSNNGNQVINGSLTFTKDPVLTFSSISQSGTVATPTGFTYDFTNLQPFTSRYINVVMLVPNVPTVQLGTYLTYTASISTLPAIDAVPEDNTWSSNVKVSNSYDPNDITESHGDKIVYSTFTPNDYLYYTVRFENIGNAPAINVKVNKILNAKLDENSIEMIGSSSNLIMDRTGSTVNWDFKNVMLPAAGGKGYLIYKIKPKPGYMSGDIIPSSVSIYFDSNPAVVTNTFNTEFVSQLGVEEFENASFVFYPNPTKDVVTVSLKDKQDDISNITVYSLLGKVIFDKKFSNSALETINLSNASKGIYLIEVTTQSNLKVIKKLIVE